jgi:hypothetical protein
MAENKVDPTVAGLFLVGFATLLFGIIGILIFQNNADHATYLGATLSFMKVFALIFVLFAYMASKVGNAFVVALFAFIAVSFFAVTLAFQTGLDFYQGLYIAALFYLIFTLVAFLIGAPKLVALLLLVVTFLFFFVGLFMAMGDLPYAAAFGIFGIVAFIISTYTAFALSTQKLPVF